MTAGAIAGPHMDRIYRHQRHIYDLTRKYYLLGRDTLIRDLAPKPGDSVIELGCGTGRNLIVAARLYPEARFFGFDVSAAMLETARANIARAGLAHRIRLAEADATNFDPAALFGEAHFDRLFFSYTLSMIPDWRGALDRASCFIAPDGRLQLVDFGQQERLPRAFRSLLVAWLSKFDVTPRAQLRQAIDEIGTERHLASAWAPQFRGYAWAARLVAGNNLI